MKKLLILFIFIIPFSAFCQFGDYNVTTETKGNSDSFQIITTYVKKKVSLPVDTIVNDNVYYISNSGIDNVSRTGKNRQEWKTLAFAIANAKPGSTIHIKAGTYNINSQINVPVGVSIEGDGIDKTILNSTVNNTIYTATFDYSSQNEGTKGNQSLKGLTLDGNLIGVIPVWVLGRGNIEISNCKIINFLERGINFYGKTHSSDGPPAIYAIGNSIHDCIIENCAGYINGVGGQGNLSFCGQENMIIYNNTISAIGRGLYKDGVGIKSVACRGHNKNVKIYNNIINSSLTDYDANDSYNFALEIWNNQGLEIYDNKIYGTIDIGGDFENTISVHNNFIGHNEIQSVRRIGIILEASSELNDISIYSNTLRNCNHSFDFYPTLNAKYSNISIHHNLIYDCGYKAIGYKDCIGIALQTHGIDKYSLTNINIHNNTIVGLDYTGFFPSTAIRFTAPVSGECNNLFIDNNILCGFYRPFIADGGSVIPYFYCRNNDFFDNENNNPSNSCKITNYSNIKNIFINPLFSIDFILQEQSCKNYGTDGKNIGAF